MKLLFSDSDMDSLQENLFGAIIAGKSKNEKRLLEDVSDLFIDLNSMHPVNSENGLQGDSKHAKNAYEISGSLRDNPQSANYGIVCPDGTIRKLELAVDIHPEQASGFNRFYLHVSDEEAQPPAEPSLFKKFINLFKTKKDPEVQKWNDWKKICDTGKKVKRYLKWNNINVTEINDFDRDHPTREEVKLEDRGDERRSVALWKNLSSRSREIASERTQLKAQLEMQAESGQKHLAKLQGYDEYFDEELDVNNNYTGENLKKSNEGGNDLPGIENNEIFLENVEKIIKDHKLGGDAENLLTDWNDDFYTVGDYSQSDRERDEGRIDFISKTLSLRVLEAHPDYYKNNHDERGKVKGMDTLVKNYIKEGRHNILNITDDCINNAGENIYDSFLKYSQNNLTAGKTSNAPRNQRVSQNPDNKLLIDVPAKNNL